MKNIIEEELYKLKDDKKTFDFIDNKDCVYYKELDFAISILEKILEKIRKSDRLYIRNNEIYKNVKISIDTSNGYYKDENVDVKITDKFVIIRNKETKIFYNIKEIEYFSITQNESEVEQ